MALTVKDILLLPGLERFNLAAGEKGLGNTVVSAGVADYEFSHEPEECKLERIQAGACDFQCNFHCAE